MSDANYKIGEDLVKKLMDNDFDGAKEYLHNTDAVKYALGWLAWENNCKAVEYLFSNAAEAIAMDEDSLYVDEIMCELCWGGNNRDYREMVGIFVRHGAYISTHDNTPLWNACSQHNIELAMTLIMEGAELDEEQYEELFDINNKAMFLVAAHMDDIDGVREFLDAGADINPIREFCSENVFDFAEKYKESKNLHDKLQNDMGKADKLVASINEDAEAPAKQAKSTRQKI